MKIDSSSLTQALQRSLDKARRYAGIGFVVFFVAIYGYLGWRIFSLNSVEPDPSAVASQLKTAGVPRVDPTVLSKIQQLQDNSVEVQTLFDNARSNPFQE